MPSVDDELSALRAAATVRAQRAEGGSGGDPAAREPPAAARPTRPSILVAQAAGLAKAKRGDGGAGSFEARERSTRPSILVAQAAGLTAQRREEIENQDEEAKERAGSAGAHDLEMEHVAGRAEEKRTEFETKNEAIREIKGLIAEFHEMKSPGGGAWGGGRAAAPQDDANNHGDTNAVVDTEMEAMEYIMGLMGENGAVFDTRSEAIRAIKGLLAEFHAKNSTRAMASASSVKKLYERQASMRLVSITEDSNDNDSTDIDPWSAGDDEAYAKFLRFLKHGGEIR